MRLTREKVAEMWWEGSEQDGVLPRENPRLQWKMVKAKHWELW